MCILEEQDVCGSKYIRYFLSLKQVCCNKELINAKAGILHFLSKSNGVGGKSCVEPEQLDFDRLRAVSFF